jgi:hypothetical protein
MTPLDDLLDAEDVPTDDGIALIAELVAAVTWLRRGAMPGLTLWDAIEQALRYRLRTEVDWRESDPLRAALSIAIEEQAEPVARLLSDAVRIWLVATSQVFNDCNEWRRHR